MSEPKHQEQEESKIAVPTLHDLLLLVFWRGEPNEEEAEPRKKPLPDGHGDEAGSPGR